MSGTTSRTILQFSLKICTIAAYDFYFDFTIERSFQCLGLPL